MAAKKQAYRVTATMIVVKVPGAQGGEVYLRRGRTIPATVDPDEIKRLSMLGLIEKFDVPEDESSDEEKAAADEKAKAAAAKQKAEADKKAADDAAKQKTPAAS